MCELYTTPLLPECTCNNSCALLLLFACHTLFAVVARTLDEREALELHVASWCLANSKLLVAIIVVVLSFRWVSLCAGMAHKCRTEIYEADTAAPFHCLKSSKSVVCILNMATLPFGNRKLVSTVVVVDVDELLGCLTARLLVVVADIVVALPLTIRPSCIQTDIYSIQLPSFECAFDADF